MMPTSARLLKLLSLLQARRFWPGNALAEALEITPRSVRRDVDRLRALGYPVHSSGGVGGGYELGAGKELPPLPLEDDEAIAVAIGLRAAASGPVSGVEDASLRALTKLEQVLPRRLRRRLNALQEMSVPLSHSTPRVDARTLQLLASASRDAEVVRFEHTRPGGERTSRTVEPYRLVHTSARWYLLAFDLDREAWRTFRVDRLSAPAVTGRRFRPRPLPSDDVAAYVSQAVSTDPYRYRMRATLHAPAEQIRKRLPALHARVEPLDAARCSVQMGGEQLDGLALYLSYLGVEFEVHEPPELVAFLEEAAARLLRAAGAVSSSGPDARARRPPR